MAISVDWPTGVITVPQADLTFISGTLYAMDTNQFWADLKALEASEIGMPWPDIQSRNPELTIAGATYAPTIEIINGYTVTFENGMYAVRLDGTNNNIFDEGILNRNQVSLIPTNSAGLIKVESGIADLAVGETIAYTDSLITVGGRTYSIADAGGTTTVTRTA